MYIYVFVFCEKVKGLNSVTSVISYVLDYNYLMKYIDIPHYCPRKNCALKVAS